MTDRKTAVLFPGQGSQEKSMGRHLAESDSLYMDNWKQAEKICKHPLREIYWDGEARDMSQTRYLQPALTVVNLNLWLKCRNLVRPEFTAGHSLGEFSALAAAEVLDFQSTIRTVSLRGRLMAEAGKDSPGAMAAVLKIPQDQVQEMVNKIHRQTGKTLVLANCNTPRQFVVSGHQEAVQLLEPEVKNARGRMVMLPVSGAFHSPMMDEAARELAAFMDRLDWHRPRISIYFNATAQAENNPQEIRRIMQRQMTSPVYFMQIIAGMSQQGADAFLELGPKGILSRMIPAILDSEDPKPEIISISSLENISELEMQESETNQQHLNG
ncbi:MAG: ACP S-malonyltransferase [Desulfonatronovibrionaceae bacterium]